MTATDLSENSKQNKELFSFSDVVKTDFVSVGLKSDVDYQYVFEVPSVFLGEKHINTLHSLKDYTTPKSGVTICIRDKIRVV